jgi:hypothetical protein
LGPLRGALLAHSGEIVRLDDLEKPKEAFGCPTRRQAHIGEELVAEGVQAAERVRRIAGPLDGARSQAFACRIAGEQPCGVLRRLACGVGLGADGEERVIAEVGRDPVPLRLGEVEDVKVACAADDGPAS